MKDVENAFGDWQTSCDGLLMYRVYAADHLLAQGLIMKYRFLVLNTLEGKTVSAAPGQLDDAVNTQRMRALEGQVLQAKLESNDSKTDAAKVQCRSTRSLCSV